MNSSLATILTPYLLRYFHMVIRVLHVIGGLNAAGAESAVMNWLRTIDRKKYQFDFVVHYKDNFYSPEAKKLGSKIYLLPNPEKSGVFVWKKSFEELLKKNKYDVVHSHLFYFNGIVLHSAYKMKVPVRISHSHNEKSRTNTGFVRKLYSYYSKYLINKYATVLIGCSRNANKNLYPYAESQDRRIKILHYGIKLSLYQKEFSKKASLNKFSLPQKSKIYLHIGRFAPVKNHRFLIEIFEQIQKIDKNSILILIGDGDLKQEIEDVVKLKELMKKVRFVGLTKKIPEWLSVADLMIFPSYYEGLPVTLLEAQAAGLNCLISDLITKEIDVGNGLIRFFNLKAGAHKWAQSAIKISDKKQSNQKIQQSISKISAFDINTIAKELTEIYDRAIDQKN